jgi:hypothetical protein
VNPNARVVSYVRKKEGPSGSVGRADSRRVNAGPRQEQGVSIMESGGSDSSVFDHGGGGPERPKLEVQRAAYRRFSRWMDQQLAELVRRWAHLSTPNAKRITRPVRPKSKA